jgi:hypothetical protein
MAYRLLADLVLAVHFAFIVFVIMGGWIVLRQPRAAWLHLPAVVWGALIEFFGWSCPLTPLEVFFLRRSGAAGYSGSFIEHYLSPVIYPDGLTPAMQILLGAAVVVIIGLIYVQLWRRRRLNP